jgi:hypothetical protein
MGSPEGLYFSFDLSIPITIGFSTNFVPSDKVKTMASAVAFLTVTATFLPNSMGCGGAGTTVLIRGPLRRFAVLFFATVFHFLSKPEGLACNCLVEVNYTARGLRTV